MGGLAEGDNLVKDEIEIALRGLAKVLDCNVSEFVEYGPNYSGLVTLPPEAGPNVNPLKIDNWAVFLATATEHGWVVSTGANHAITQSGIDAVSDGLEGVKSRIRRLKWSGFFLRLLGFMSSAAAIVSSIFELSKR